MSTVRRRWTANELATLRRFYPHEPTATTAARLERTVATVYQAAAIRGLKKTAEYLASPAACRLRRGDNVGAACRFQSGHVTWNKGLRRPGWAPGRMRETQFKKGGFPVNRDPDYYVVGALRCNADGYIDMRISFEPGARGWRGLHVILWEDAHGPVPPSHCVIFKNGDTLDVELDNLECISRAENMRRNTIHNMPESLRSAVMQLGQLRRRINERADKEDGGGLARASVRGDGGAAGRIGDG